jgi:hypothetical protein
MPSRGFSWFYLVKTNEGLYFKVGHDHFLARPVQYIVTNHFTINDNQNS